MIINVAIGVAEKQDKILLIKREKGDFIGLWGLPGGKVENNEHIDQTIERELLEETGMRFTFQELIRNINRNYA